MGNLAGKDGVGSSGSHFDFFQTPPSSPSAPDLTGMPLPSSSSSPSSPPAHLPSPTAKTPSPSGVVVTPMTPSPSPNSPVQAEDVLLMAEAGSEPPRGWGRGATAGTTTTITTSAPHLEGASVSPVAAPEERRSLAVHTPQWLATPEAQQKDMVAGVGDGVSLAGGGAMEGVVAEGVAVELLQVLEQHRAGLGLCSGQESVVEVLGELKKLLMERVQFTQEVKSLKQTLETERAEWLQFQSDLQVAVAVADRLRMEAEENVLLLRLDQQEAAERLEDTQERLQQAESEMEKLRRLYSEVCGRMEEQEQQLKAQGSRPLCLDQSSQTTAEAQTEKTSYSVRDSGGLGTRDKTGEVDGEGQEQLKAWRRPRSTACLDQNTHTRGETTESPCGGVQPDIAAVQDSGGEGTRDKKTEEVLGDGQTKDGKSSEERGMRRPEEVFVVVKGEVRGFGRGVTDYERRTLPGLGLRDPRKIVMLSERSRSLSRLPLPPSPPHGQDRVSHNSLDAMAPASQGQETGRESTGGTGRRLDRLLQRQDSWSSFYTSKQDDDHGTDVSSVMISKVRSDDSFSMLLRRHGGSRRNSLLRWCQKRTQGYKHIDITNFSSSWEDGLAFCAVYHTYLPTHIPYSTLLPGNKKDNLDLALKTGESVGIAATLTVEEMLRPGGPDWQRVLEYVESMFRHFEM